MSDSNSLELPEHAVPIMALLGARPLDYSNPQIQYALDCEAEQRLRLRGLLGPAACRDLRKRIRSKFLKSIS